MADFVVSPPLLALTPNDHGPAVVVATLIFVIVATITVCTRLITRYQVFQRLVLDDYFIILATFLNIAQTACLVVACKHGIGRHRQQIPKDEFIVYTKAIYAAGMLMISTLALTKASVALLIISLKPLQHTLRACYGVLGLLVVWALSANLVIAFQCRLPAPFNHDGKCINFFAFDIYNCIMNVTTDLALIAIPAVMMKNVQVSASRRWFVIGLFASRIIVVIFTLVTIITRQKAITGPLAIDYTWELVASTIWLQAMVTSSIMTACLPSIRRFLSELRTGMMGVHICEPLEMTLRNASTADAGPKIVVSKTDSPLSSRIVNKIGWRSSSSPASHDEERDHSFGSARTSLRPGTFNSTRNALSRTVVEANESKQQLAQGIIVQTIDYEVEYQTAEDVETEMRMANDRRASSLISKRSSDIHNQRRSR